MHKRSTVLIHMFSQIHSKQHFRLKFYMYIRSLLSKTCSSGIVFGKFNQIYPCTFKNLTIFNAFSYLRHVKRLGICLPRGISHSIINIHEIVTSRWRIERCHRRRASGHTSLSKALVHTVVTQKRSFKHEKWCIHQCRHLATFAASPRFLRCQATYVDSKKCGNSLF